MVCNVKAFKARPKLCSAVGCCQWAWLSFVGRLTVLNSACWESPGIPAFQLSSCSLLCCWTCLRSLPTLLSSEEEGDVTLSFPFKGKEVPRKFLSALYSPIN
eukprot:1140294-Pelagomonas_calceolata.AAC.1